jgi:hypothetical protein
LALSCVPMGYGVPDRRYANFGEFLFHALG